MKPNRPYLNILQCFITQREYILKIAIYHEKNIKFRKSGVTCQRQRWSQENFFKYSRVHFGLDSLVDYCTEQVSETTEVVNPEYRQLDSKIKSSQGKLNRLLAKFGVLTLEETIDPDNVEPYLQKKTAWQEEIDGFQEHLKTLKEERRKLPHHVQVKDLPEADQFKQLSTQSKHFIDTIKMVAQD